MLGTKVRTLNWVIFYAKSKSVVGVAAYRNLDPFFSILQILN